MKNVFIISNQDDRATAAQISDRLYTAGHQVWTYNLVQPGMDDSAHQAFQQSDVVIILLSEAIRQHPYVEHLVEEAQGVDKMLIPVLAAPMTALANVPSSKYVDATHNADEAVTNLLQIIDPDAGVTPAPALPPTIPVRKRIYISYAQPDRQAVLTIREVLQGGGHRVWGQRPDGNQRRVFDKRLMRALHRADLFIVLFSPYAVQSRLVRHEIRMARRLHKTIIPVLLTPLAPDSPVTLQRYIDATEDLDQALYALMVEINGRPMPLAPYTPAAVVAESQSQNMPLARRIKPLHAAAAVILLALALLVLSRQPAAPSATPTRQPRTLAVARDFSPMGETTIDDPASALDSLSEYDPAQVIGEANQDDDLANARIRAGAGASATDQPDSDDQPNPDYDANATPQPNDPNTGGSPTDTDIPGGGSNPLPEDAGTGGTKPTSTPTGTATDVPGGDDSTPDNDTDSDDDSSTGDDGTTTPPQDQPFAGFSVDSLAGDAPFTVTFKDQSFGQITSYAWDFNGDGVTDSTKKNPPPYTYTKAGTYNAALVVTGPGGKSDPFIEFINVYEPDDTGTNDDDTGDTGSSSTGAPLASFKVSRTSGIAPLAVTFTNESLGDITSYAWDFNGDGTTDSTKANPSAYTYKEVGSYIASLIVTGPGGESLPATRIITVNSPDLPVARFSVNPLTGTAPLTVTFTNQSSGDITSYAWDFNGDGITDSTKANPSPYTYNKAGSYIATLVVTGPGGESLPESQIIIVEAAGLPTARFTADPIFGAAPLTVTFTNQSSGDITSYAWDFNGDGITDSTKANPSPYTYNNAGSYTVKLTVRGPGGTSQPDSLIITVEAPVKPSASFTASPTTGDAPLTVTFKNQSSGSITSYAWDFNGDGITDSTKANPSPYTYAQPGTYSASLVVSGPGGTSPTVRATITVKTPAAAPTARFSANPKTGAAPLPVMFTNQSSGSITSYAWDFNGDGITDSTEATPPLYTYNQPGTYNASLVVSGPGGTSQPARTTIVVNTAQVAPTAGFSATPLVGSAPLAVTFTNQSMGSITSYNWDFNGDGLIDSTAASPPPYTYTQPGTYNASLVVSGPGGTSQPARATIVVSAPPPAPTAAFTANPLTGNAPLTVIFTNQSSGSITSYAWDFNGDGITDSTAASPPPYTYTQPGTYNASLVVSGPGGTSQPARATIVVSAPPVPATAAFTANPLTGNAPLIVTFTNQSSGNITAYAWDFNGDGITDSTAASPPPYTYTQPGTYNASLVVSGPGGTSQPARATIVVSAPPVPPTAAFTANPLTGNAPLIVIFTNQSSGHITTYAWDFNGDGLTDSTAASPPPYTYAQPGTYNASLVVSGPGGTSPQASVTIEVTAVPPTAAFTANPLTGNAPLTVTFTNQSTGGITAYDWDFNGDGITDSTAASPPPYTYTEPGTYFAALIASGPGGDSIPATVTIEVTAVPPTAAFSANPLIGNAPLTVTFTNQSTGNITAYDWDFNGDGITDSTAPAPPPYTYTEPGTYFATLIVSGPGGDSPQATVTIEVTAVPPTAAFSANPLTGNAPLTVTFTNQSTGNITAYAWDFNGDGITDSTAPAPPPYAYTEPGTYFATLIVSGPGGDSVPSTVTIVVDP